MKRLFFLQVLIGLLIIETGTVFAGKKTIPSYNLENEVVRKYMAKGPYDGFGSADSYFSDNAEFPQKYAQDKPQHITLTWEGDTTRTYTVTLADARTGFKRPVLQEKVQGTSLDITNLIPQKQYIYKIQCQKKKIKSGAFRTEGQVRMLDIDNCCNARDLGGWTGLDGRIIRYGWLYRSGSIDGEYTGVGSDNCGGSRCTHPNHVAAQTQVGDPAKYILHDSSVKALAQIGILADMDLRGMTDEGRWGNQCMAHTRSLGQTKIPDAAFRQIMTDEALYNPLKDPAVVQDVAWIIQELKEGHPVVFHCRSGADRTGAVAMLIEALLGVSAGDIARDYELTSLSSEGRGQTRSAKSALTSSYGFFAKGFTTLDVPATDPTERLQQQSYAYLNSFFENDSISKEDLDWFINFMLIRPETI